jgi:TRAP-type C4-dicarboxylate transport system permease small subunit
MLLTVIGAVVLRYVFGFSFRWTDELARYLFIYIVFLGIPIAYRENIHAAIKYFTSTFFNKIKFALQVFCDILIGITSIYIAYYTIIMIQGRLGKTLSPGLKMPMTYIYISVLFCIGLLLIEIIRRLAGGYQSLPSNDDFSEEVDLK